MKPILAGLLALGALAGASDSVVEVIVVRNRPAADLVSVLQPLAAPDGVVTASGDRLVIRASPSSLAQIKRVLADLDTPPRSLWISVRQGVERTTASHEAEASVRTSSGGRSRTVVTGALVQGHSHEAGSDVQRLQVLEGTRAFIRIGTAVPVPQVVVGPGTITTGTAYQEAETGFYVVPRVAGDIVTLEVSTRRDTPGPGGTLDIQHVDTTVSGRLGEWLTLGSAGRDDARSSSGILSKTGERIRDDRSVLLKVEEVR